MLREFKPKADLILANEIPVGNSASILQAMNPNKSLTRALELYMDVVHPNKTNSKGSKQASAASSSAAAAAAAAAKKSYLVGKKPVIVVPKGMTAPITLVNAYDFVCNGQFVPRDVVVMGGGRGQQRAAPQTTFTRTVRNSGMLEYEIIDNPKKLGPDLKEWERIVAVIVLGQSWQFKDWPPPYNDAVQLFSRTFGYYIGMEGNKVPAEVSGWAVSQAQLNRDKHGMDKVTHANFWNKLDEWMMVNKRELLPQQDS
jgi:parafibromin